MSIDIPTDTLRELVRHPDDFQREVILAMYEANEITSGKACEILGLDVQAWDMLRRARRLRGAYGVEDLESDVRTLKELGRL
ncbi:MAG: hypothetical protein QOE70_5023 [Chthoniobacter sp.]|jgi:predicted HTH domain antitoxin|nr:hypothetical protein [Chthoniobacter sp.]